MPREGELFDFFSHHGYLADEAAIDLHALLADLRQVKRRSRARSRR
jgi:hypothetical protein